MDGRPHSGADKKRGVALRQAVKTKLQTYPELARSHDLRLVVAAVEIGGRLHHAAKHLLRVAAHDRVSDEPPALRAAVGRAYLTRWRTFLSVATQDSIAATLCDDGVGILDGAAGSSPPAMEMLLDCSDEELFSWHAEGISDTDSASDPEALMGELASAHSEVGSLAESVATTPRADPLALGSTIT